MASIMAWDFASRIPICMMLSVRDLYRARHAKRLVQKALCKGGSFARYLQSNRCVITLRLPGFESGIEKR